MLRESSASRGSVATQLVDPAGLLVTDAAPNVTAIILVNYIFLLQVKSVSAFLSARTLIAPTLRPGYARHGPAGIRLRRTCDPKFSNPTILGDRTDRAEYSPSATLANITLNHDQTGVASEHIRFTANGDGSMHRLTPLLLRGDKV